MAFFAVQTSANQQPRVIDSLKQNSPDAFRAFVHPARGNGYFVVEADDDSTLRSLVGDIPQAHKVVGEIGWGEVTDLIKETETFDDIDQGSLVEITGMKAYEGDKARVTGINPQKGTVTVELHEELIPIQITVNREQFRVLD
jgi:transcription elongation factor Spt5